MADRRLPREARCKAAGWPPVALALKLAGGLSVGEIARGFLAEVRSPNDSFARSAGSAATTRTSACPGHASWRRASVLDALYLMFNEGLAPEQRWLTSRLSLLV